jgi:hypothetical protein
MIRQRGQSLAEFAVGAAALSLLMLGSITLGGYQEVDRRSVIAARQAAFEGSWVGDRATDAALRETLFRRNFEDAGLAMAAGNGRPVEPEQISLAASVTAPGGVAQTATQLMLAPLEVASGFLGGGFNLTAGGFRTGEIGTRIEPIQELPAPFNSMTLQLHAPYGLMTDAWHAGGLQQVRSRAGGLVPTAALGQVPALWRALLAPLSLVEPSLAQFCPGLIESDRIPEDRLGPGRTPLRRTCQ